MNGPMNAPKGTLGGLLRAGRLAVGLLTIVPVFRAAEPDEPPAATPWAVAFFPLVGLMMGLVLYGLAIAMTGWPRYSAAAILVVALAILSGGLHLDGLSDTADALAAGHRSGQAKILEVMKDPHIGVFGALAILLVLLGKVALIGAIPSARLPWAVLALPALGRFPFLVFIPFLRYVRSSGTAGPFSGAGWVHFAAGVAITVPASLLAGPAGIAALVAVAAWTALFALYFARRLGGYTGDVLGAAAETSEVVALLAMTLMLR